MEIIKEDLLDERSLSTLASAICLKFGDLIYQNLVEWKGKIDWGTYSFFYLKELNNSKYMSKVDKGTTPFNDALNEFIVYTNIKISIVRGKYGHGTYITRDGEKYSIGDKKEIILEVDPEQFKERIINAYKDGEIKNGKDVFLKLYYLIYSTLLHELRHAYDDFRTRGGVFKNKEAQRFLDDQKKGKHKLLKQAANKAESIADETIRRELEKMSLQYIKLPHEVWARYSQAIENVKFVNVEFDDDLTFPETMKPVHDVVKDFKYNMVHFKLLPEKVQKRLIKAVVNAWHDAKDYLDKYGTYINMHNKKLHEINSKVDTQELEDEIEMRLLPTESFLSYNDIVQISDIFGLDEEEITQAVSLFVMKREKEKYKEAKRDIEEYVQELQSHGVRTDVESTTTLTQAFLDAHGNYHVDELGISFDILKGIVGMATKDPDQLKLFENVRRKIQKIIFRSLVGTP